MTARMYVQFQNAPKFRGLLSELQDYLVFPIDDYYEEYFNIATCNTEGLNNWGRILNQARSILVYDYSGVFGFNNGVAPVPIDTGYPQNFGHGNFFSGETTLTELDNTQYRALLGLRYLSYTVLPSAGVVTQLINAYIQEVYNDPLKKCQLVEGDMEFAYNFNFRLSNYERQLFRINNILPRPAGVKSVIEDTP